MPAVATVQFFEIFENVSLLLVGANHVFKLFFVLLHSVTRWRHRDFPPCDLFKVEALEEWMILDLVSTAWTSSETARWVSIQKVHDDVLGVL